MLNQLLKMDFIHPFTHKIMIKSTDAEKKRFIVAKISQCMRLNRGKKEQKKKMKQWIEKIKE